MSELAALVWEASWRVLPPALAAVVAHRVLRRRSPRAAHAVWVVLLAGMLVLPPLIAFGPRWPIAVTTPRFAAPLLTRTAEGRPSPTGLVTSISDAWPAAPGAERGRLSVDWGTVYGAGLAVLLGRFFFGLAAASRLRRAGRELGHSRLEAMAQALLPGRAVAFRSSLAVRVPFTTGLFRPLVFLPPDWEDWREEALRGAVGHELCHVRRRDYAWTVLAELNRCLYWFDPLAWLLPRTLSRLADRIGDELGAAAVRNRSGYARLLVEMAERISVRPGRLTQMHMLLRPPTLPMVGTDGLAARVEALLARRSREPRRPWAGAWAGSALAVALLASAAVEVGAGPGPGLVPAANRSDSEAGLASANAEARAAAVLELARSRGLDAIPDLLALLGDEAPIATPPGWRDLRPDWSPARAVWLHPSPGEVATIGLASFGSASALPLLSALASSDPVVRRHAAWGLGEIRQPRGIPKEGLDALVRALADPDAEVRAAAAWAAGDIRIPAAVPDLLRLLHDPSPRIRAEAALALGEIRSSASEADLEIAHQRERDPVVRAAIRGALAELR